MGREDLSVVAGGEMGPDGHLHGGKEHGPDSVDKPSRAPGRSSVNHDVAGMFGASPSRASSPHAGWEQTPGLKWETVIMT